jgi:hypothetical protein
MIRSRMTPHHRSGRRQNAVVSRATFLKWLGVAAASGIADSFGTNDTEETNAESVRKVAGSGAASTVPGYLRGYEALYRKDPRAAAIEWHRNTKWGLFLHYALASLRGMTAEQSAKAKSAGAAEWKKLKQGTPEEYAKLKDRFTAEKFDADFITDLAVAAEMHYIKLYAYIRSLQPQCLISFKQGTGTEDFVAPEGIMHAKNGALAQTGWTLNAGKRGDICTNLQTSPPSWIYLDGCQHATADEVRALLADAFAQQANLTINTGLLPDGSVHPADVASLRAAGARIRKDGYPAPARLDRTERKKLKGKSQ